MTRACVAFLLAATLSACVQTNAAMMDNSLRLARTCPAGVRLYSSPSKVEGEYQEVALLNSSGLSQFTNESQMMSSMREKASELGATGVIMGNIDEPGAGAKVAAQVLGAYTERKGKSVAVFVPSDTARVAVVCGGGGSRAVSLANPRSTPTVIKQSSATTVQTGPVASTSAVGKTAEPSPPTGTWAQTSIGRARSESDKDQAMKAFEDGRSFVGSHEWEKAEQSFQKAILFDGAVAKYHAGMGSLMMLLHRWADAEASYTAAMLIDVDNPEYRRMVKEARSRR